MPLSNDLQCQFITYVNSIEDLRGKPGTEAGLGLVSSPHCESGWAVGAEPGRNDCLKMQPSRRIKRIWTEGMKEKEKDEPGSYHEKGMF